MFGVNRLMSLSLSLFPNLRSFHQYLKYIFNLTLFPSPFATSMKWLDALLYSYEFLKILIFSACFLSVPTVLFYFLTDWLFSLSLPFCYWFHPLSFLFGLSCFLFIISICFFFIFLVSLLKIFISLASCTFKFVSQMFVISLRHFYCGFFKIFFRHF